MLISTSGSRLFIADPRTFGTGSGSGDWVEIGETEAIGMLGVEWEVQSVDVMFGAGPDGGPGELAIKGAKRRPEVPLIMGNDPSDPGQQMLWTAAHSDDSWLFRLVFPDGTTTREWAALVVRMGEVFDGANSAMRLQADLKPTSDAIRSGGI